MQPQQRFAEPRIVDRDVLHRQRGKVDIGEHRVLQRHLQPRRLLCAAVARQLAHVHPVSARQPQQHVGGQRPLVPLQQRDIGSGDFEVRRHIRLRQPQLPPQPPQARPHIDGTILGHVRVRSCADITTIQRKFVKIDN